ncbi:basement membrane-specific heparan sulfate proteoglycan core protein isoform X4 [Drosophila busckii]|uniref:basement membrane-specific heparan sulfate proteoglycan core protein isoform X4 n=1 Tax=Drosophila busckii TaxID=30019 RepID=UPI00083F0A8A|nr:basement membrane-specific heparan sulfate proteoglycan core protein isoform X4 [Drosophila busckii]
MGSTGSQTGRNGPQALSLLWRLFAILLVLNACHISFINAKQISNVEDNDNMFIDGEGAYALDDDVKTHAYAPLIDDAPMEGSWFHRGVRRVRRELTRLFGKDKDAHQHHHHRQKRLSHAVYKRKTAQPAQKSNRKRASDYYEGEGGSGTEIVESALYRTRFTVNEPYRNDFADKQSDQFRTLNDDIQTGLRNLLRDNYDNDDSDNELHSTLLQVGPTDDQYKSYVIVNLDMPGNVVDFESKLRKQLQTYHKIGEQSASFDNDFYFRPIQESQRNEDPNQPNPYAAKPTNPELDTDPEDNDIDADTEPFDENEADDQCNSPNESFQCNSGSPYMISCNEVCDNVPHCEDHSDEDAELCELINQKRARQQPPFQQPQEQDANPERSPTPNWENFSECKSDDDDFQCPYGATLSVACSDVCNGRHDCEDGADENPEKCNRRNENNNSNNNNNNNNNNNFEDTNTALNANANPNYLTPTETTDEIESSGDVECRGDATFFCHRSDTRVCDEMRCDGISNCPNNEDEENCPAPPVVCNEYEFKCDENRCLALDYRCDGVTQCDDETDEAECPKVEPEPVEPDEEPEPQPDEGAETGPDPDQEPEPQPQPQPQPQPEPEPEPQPDDNRDDERTETPECHANEFRCHNGQCIDASKRCNNEPDCSEGEDEGDDCPAACSDQEYQCRDTRCISLSLQCDGRNDCNDGDDEEHCDGSGFDADSCQFNEFRCGNGECIPIRQVCDNIYDCTDYTDEQSCDPNDIKDNFDTVDEDGIIRNYGDHNRRTQTSKDYGNHNHNRNEHNDNNNNIDNNGLHELDVNEYEMYHPHDIYENPNAQNTCAPNQFKCRNNICIPLHLRCDGYRHCNDMSDEDNCDQYRRQPTTRGPTPIRTTPTPRATTRTTRTTTRPNVYPWATFGPDALERKTSTTTNPYTITTTGTARCAEDQFRCRNGDCVSQDAVCNGYAECQDASDEADCDLMTCQAHQFRCRNGQCVSATLRCNGQTDCQDSSDEMNCAQEQHPPNRNQLKLKTYPDSQIIKESREVVFRCRDEGPARAKVRWTRPGGLALPVGFSDKNGRLEIPNIRVEDSGTYLCEAVGYPNYEPGQHVTVHLTVERFNAIDHERPPTACTEYQATCMNGECIDKSQICDGTPHCSDQSDEHSCSHGRRCQPNQFLCNNQKCVERTWRCDGENDCGDNSDEESCDPEPSGAPCRYNEFQCSSGHCIPKSFLCDDVNDCRDGSDEIGCIEPVPIRPPPPMVQLDEGQALDLTCTATGKPMPTIVWRLNWGHVPDKCVSKSTAVGTTVRGDLHCPDMQYQDSGAYSCEIINTRGTHFVTPDSIVKVTPHRNQYCEAGFFNMLARSREDCIKCFCFGVASSCDSANLFSYAIQPPILSHRVVTVELSPYQQLVINDATGHNLVTLHHGVRFRASDVQYNSRESPYLALPSEYMGNQLKSYGGQLKYEMSYTGTGRPSSGPDVIMTGNGFTLTNRVRIMPNQVNKVAVSFLPGSWLKPDGRRATREEIMMILANVDNILIRLSYIEATEREVELVNIAMDSAGTSDQGLGSASLVEKCNCPPGYVGDSCESCAPGFVRQPGGAWLGHCVPFVPEPCPSGTYGDPRRGIPCRDCPCPQSGSNNFATGCQLSPDGDVICNCRTGYIGRRCETCADGYQGNPLAPGGSCQLEPDSSCDAEGTLQVREDGSCHCKQLVQGDRCDTCAPRSFHLNSFTYTGCIECFCSGLDSATCTSSSWYRDQVSTSFGHSRSSHGFNLIRNYPQPEPAVVQPSNRGLTLNFNMEQENSADVLYWSLPAEFLGNKLTAYGGKLNYTLSYSPQPGGQMSRNNAPDVVISGEDMLFVHTRKSAVSPSVSSSYAVPIIESNWQRPDGQVANRELLLMALSKVSAIYIKATYTTSTREGALQHVTLDTAKMDQSGNAMRAYEVEECRCPTGYQGLSCERCAPGFKRHNEDGLYLGLCDACECNGHSTECDAESGVCMNCADNTDGDFCDRCADGYTGDATRGSNGCQPRNDDDRPEPQPQPDPDNQLSCSWCNQDGTQTCSNNVCHCKPNVVGDLCDKCRAGTFGMSHDNANGCKDCYCSGVSNQCSSASLYRQLIPVDFIDSKPLITDEDGVEMDKSTEFDIINNMYIYAYPSYSIKYWSLRGKVLGNKLNSYGGELQYTLLVESNGQFQPGSDVILIGNGIRLIWSRPSEDSHLNDYRVRLHETDQWRRKDRGSIEMATRNDFMTVLANLEHILIRANPKIPTERSSIANVILESSIDVQAPGSRHAVDIEVCKCPAGYTGNSCETCAPMHYRDENGHCRSCPCVEENSHRCFLGSNGYVECQCKSRYTGDRCQDIDYNNNENNNEDTDNNEDADNNIRTQIVVSIAKPQITIMPVGGSMSLSCSGHMKWNNDPVVVSWYKENSRLPSTAEVDGGMLHIYNLQITDSGVYICQAINQQTQRPYTDKVSITVTHESQRSPARIVNWQNSVTFEEYQPNEINCEAEGNPMPVITWTRVDGQVDGHTRTDNGRLIFDSPRRSDEGRYRCQANNNEGQVDERYVELHVRVSGPQPPPMRERVYIQPQDYNGYASDTVRFTCQSTSGASLHYQWLHDGRPLSSQQQRNIYISGDTLEIRDATPRDSGIYTCVGTDLRSRRNYTENARVYIEDRHQQQPDDGIKPRIAVMTDQHSIVQGADLSITCEASGSPYPSIKWMKVSDSLASNVQITGNVLRIINAMPDNRGIYLCLAENPNGSDQASTTIDVEPRERPSIEITPSAPQTYQVGAQGLLYCAANGIPTPTVQWRRIDGSPLTPRHKEQSPGYILIDDIQVADAGDYECVAENAVGRVTGVATLRITEQPLIQLDPDQSLISYTEGDEVRISCIASGYPNPSVSWDGGAPAREFMPAGQPMGNIAHLNIYRVTQADARVYTCTATNEAGTDERTIRIEVKAKRGDVGDADGDVDSNPHQPDPYRPPYQPQRPNNYGENQRFTTNLGDNVTLTCELGPYLTARWERVDGQPLLHNAHSVQNKLIILFVEERNLGQYRCNALDSRNSVVTYVVRELVLLPLPQITFRPGMPLEVETDRNVEIYCQATNARREDVHWATDNNRPLSSSVITDGPVLRFIAIRPADAGGYICTASNQYGNTTSTAQVVVRPPNRYETVPYAKTQIAREGDSFQLSCVVEHNTGVRRDNVQFNWYREDGQPLPHNARPDTAVLTLTSLRMEDAGRYICDSYDINSGRHLPETSVDLRVQQGAGPEPGSYLPPAVSRPEPIVPHRDYSLKLDTQSSSLRIGESTEVECYASDKSYTDVIWERVDGAPLNANVQQVGNRLMLNEVTAADEGNYICKCRTDAGDLYTTSYVLTIEAQPHELKRPKIVYAQVGDRATLDCGADEQRRPNYRWSRQYGQLQAGRDINEDELILVNVQANDAGSYICTGIYPDGESIDYPSILVVSGAIPQFQQQPLSYMSFPTLPNSAFMFNFEITFRPESANGLLLFNGQTRGMGDYIALSLKDRYAEFRFDFAGKPMLVRAEQPLQLNEWHTVRVHRSRRDGYMQLDEQHPVAFPTLTQTPQMELTEDLYIGGVPNWDMLPAEAMANGQHSGFVGCISRLTLQGRTHELMKDAKLKEGITSCKPCAQSPCANGGICLESQTELAYTCVCQKGWTGRNCAVEGTQCTPGICGAGRCENTELDMECLCPLNRTGDRCQYIEHLSSHSLNFKRNSYAAYGTPRVAHLNITMSVRPSSLRDALLLYTAESKLPSGDYVALVLRDGHVELIINTAARLKPVIVRSQQPLALHRWTRVELLRRQGGSILRVGDEPEQRAKAAGAPRILSLKTPLYVGGYDRASVKINRDINITDGFDGCVSRLYDSNRAVQLISDIVDAANVQNCGELNEISGDHDADSELPSMPAATAGGAAGGGATSNDNTNSAEDEQMPQTPCASDPCENGGICNEVDNQPICDCQLGFSGKRCEEHIQIGFNASFRGSGYMELDRNQFSTEVDQKYTTVVVVFSTTKPNGLLLWWGQKAGENFDGQDFIALAVADGMVEFALRLNGEETLIRHSDTPVDDGQRHIVILKRTENTAILEVDRISDFDETRPTKRKEMHLPGNVYIGGTPNIEAFTGKRYTQNFNGCIVFVEGDAAGQMNLGNAAVKGVNVDTCPVNDEAQGGTEPPVV